MRNDNVPSSLRTWFFIHFLVDYLFAVPLFVAPIWVLRLLGWTNIDPFSARLVAAALFAIGGISFLARNAGKESYATLLMLKIIWSLAASAGVLFTIGQGGPAFGWIVLLLFVGFSSVWLYYKRKFF